MLGHLFVIQDWPSVTGLIFFLQSLANYTGDSLDNEQSAGMLFYNHRPFVVVTYY